MEICVLIGARGTIPVKSSFSIQYFASSDIFARVGIFAVEAIAVRVTFYLHSLFSLRPPYQGCQPVAKVASWATFDGVRAGKKVLATSHHLGYFSKASR
jgi:hypothetical protein